MVPVAVADQTASSSPGRLMTDVGAPIAIADIPRPWGWFALCTSGAVPAGTARPARFGEDELVVWRDASGRLGVARAWCPHLGAHLGHVGRVRGDVLECGFHGFRFDAAGQCRATGYGGRVPARARLSTFAVTEVAGAVLAWFPPRHPKTGHLGAGPLSSDNGLPVPAWDLSAPTNDGWTAVKWKASTFVGHPLETTENSVDVGHLSFLHGYHDVVALGQACAEDHVLRARYQMTRRGRGLSSVLPAMRTEFDVVVEGLGFSRVELTVHTIGARVRLFVLPTPVGRGQVQVLLGVSARLGPLPSAPAVLRHLPPGLLARSVRAFTLSNLDADVRQDRHIWATKRHLRHPVLADGDGPIGLYRRWAAQFLEA